MSKKMLNPIDKLRKISQKKPKLLPILASISATLIILFLVWYVERAEKERYQEEIRANVLNNLSAVRARLEETLNQRLFLAKGLVGYISAINPEINQTEFERMAEIIIAEEPGILNMSLYKDSIVSHLHPLEGFESAMGFDPRTIPEEKEAIERAIDTRQTIVAGPIDLVPQGIAFISRTPIFLTPPGAPPQSDRYWGMVGVIVDRDTLFKEAGLFDLSNSLQLAIRGKDGLGEKGEVFFGEATIFQGEPILLPVTLPNGSWQIGAIPKNGWPTVAPISPWLWSGGTIAAALAGGAVFVLVSAPVRLQRAVDRATGALRKSETALKQANANLQRLDKLKDEFIANTSHELRTPLNGIIGIAESLVDGVAGTLPPSANSNLAIVVACSRRLANFIDDLLDFSRLRHGKLELQIKPVGVREIVDVVVALSQPLLKTKPELTLVNSVPPDLPLADADENRLEQVFHNLIGNAIKFSQRGKVEVLAEGRGEEIVITVSDTGIGIAPEQFDRIFESFQQADGTTAREYGGTGLGLTISKQLVELQGGKIWLTSTVGVGSGFSFSLPVAPEQVREVSEETGRSTPEYSLLSQESALGEEEVEGMEVIEEVKEVEGAIGTGEEFKILIVDDEPINLQVLANNLSLENYSITQANNGLEALELIDRGFKPDLILLDVMMPRMTGYEVSQKIREKFMASELPILMLTAKNQVSDLVEGFTSGANDYLTKPFNKKELLARIKTHLNLLKINSAYGRFVPQDFLKFLGRESILDVRLGDHVQKEMTILFSDIRSFTNLSEEMTPQENFNFINNYLKEVSPIVRNHSGFIDKYIGDAVMALFPESPDDAVQSAISMQRQVASYNKELKLDNIPPIAIGVGLHTGTLMLGTIGERERMESTVIADAVNLASRLEGLTKVYGAGILISENTLIGLQETYQYRFLEKVTVKGKKTAVGVFEIYDHEPEEMQRLKRETADIFAEAVDLYSQQKYAEAQQKFEEILGINSGDKVAKLFGDRCCESGEYRRAQVVF